MTLKTSITVFTTITIKTIVTIYTVMTLFTLLTILTSRAVFTTRAFNRLITTKAVLTSLTMNTIIRKLFYYNFRRHIKLNNLLKKDNLYLALYYLAHFILSSAALMLFQSFKLSFIS